MAAAGEGHAHHPGAGREVRLRGRGRRRHTHRRREPRDDLSQRRRRRRLCVHPLWFGLDTAGEDCRVRSGGLRAVRRRRRLERRHRRGWRSPRRLHGGGLHLHPFRHGVDATTEGALRRSRLWRRARHGRGDRVEHVGRRRADQELERRVGLRLHPQRLGLVAAAGARADADLHRGEVRQRRLAERRHGGRRRCQRRRQHSQPRCRLGIRLRAQRHDLESADEADPHGLPAEPPLRPVDCDLG